MKFGVSVVALATGLAMAGPAGAQQAAVGAVPPTVISPGTGGVTASPGAAQAAPAQTGAGETGGATPAPPQVGTTVFPPVENTVPGSEGAIVFPPAESITGVGGTGQTVLPSPEQTVPGPGGFPFTDPNVPGGVQQNLQQGGVAGTGTVGTGAVVGTGQTTGVVDRFGNVLNRNQLLTQPGLAAPTGSQVQPPATQNVFLGGDLNQGFSVGPLTGQGAVAVGTLPAVPQGLGAGSRPGDGAWIGADVEDFDADEPDALDFSRSP